ncbi:MAG: squalene--hopene cyclase [Planctomycetia bacterium]|nr:squalene--hopene cyclase [Planctomycetia bacterium]
MSCSPDRIRRAYETAKAALLAEMISKPVSADDPVQKLLDEPVSEMRHWVGELSTSALSTATAVMALEQMRRQYVIAGRDVPEVWTRLIQGGCEWLIAHQNADGGWGDTIKSISNISTTMLCHAVLVATESFNRVPQECSLSEQPASASRPTSDAHACGLRLNEVMGTAATYIDRAGGVPAVIARYGKDHTFSVPILTHCALAGLVDWGEVISLPFELACIPARFYAAVRLPVVSYALPALIAIGQVRFHFRPSWNPLRRWLQRWAKPASLRVLERIQPPHGGFLEATPLTSFVTMSLASMGLQDHPVAQRGIEFIVASARWDDASRPTELASVVPGPLHYDNATDEPRRSAEAREPPRQARWGESDRACSWPIDTNLATWVTTLSINALGDDVPLDARPGLRAWLLRQQYRVVHPYTNAAPGGWAWTDLPGGVPDADDTPGAKLAIATLKSTKSTSRRGNRTTDSDESNKWSDAERESNGLAIQCLVNLQNRDGGWPTFCRGWGTLPFDRSSPDITAHCIRAFLYRMTGIGIIDSEPLLIGDPVKEREFLRRNRGFRRFDTQLGEGIAIIDEDEMTDWFAVDSIIASIYGLRFLKRTQRPDGSWLPLWFGNQHAPNDENPTYGTAKVLAAFQALGRMSDESAVRGVRWLVENQNPDGGWGAGPGTPSSVEETALALEALLGCRVDQRSPHAPRDEPSAETASDEDRRSSSGKERLGHSAPHPEREGDVDDVDTAISLGLSWLIARVEDGRFREPSPIGFYFAKLWYFEALYPLIFTVAALRKAVAVADQERT